MKKVSPYMKDIIESLAYFRKPKYLIEQMLNILDYVLDSKGDILNAYVSVLRDNGITSTLKRVEDNLELLDNF